MTPLRYVVTTLAAVGPLIAVSTLVGTGPPIAPGPDPRPCMQRLDAVHRDRINTLQTEVWDLDQQHRQLDLDRRRGRAPADWQETLANLDTQRQDLRARLLEAQRDRVDYRPCSRPEPRP
jgi:hypothetical protein